MSILTTSEDVTNVQFKAHRLQFFKKDWLEGYDVNEVDEWVDEKIAPTLDHYEKERDKVVGILLDWQGTELDLKRRLLDVLGIQPIRQYRDNARVDLDDPVVTEAYRIPSPNEERG